MSAANPCRIAQPGAAKLGPPPAWVPTAEGMADTNAARFMATWQGDDTWRQLRCDPGMPDLSFFEVCVYLCIRPVQLLS